jgi:hypothetical protein
MPGATALRRRRFRSISSDMRRIRAVRPAQSRAAAKNQLQRSRLERGDCSQRLYDLEIFLDERRTGRSEIRRDFQLKRTRPMICA